MALALVLVIFAFWTYLVYSFGYDSGRNHSELNDNDYKLLNGELSKIDTEDMSDDLIELEGKIITRINRNRL